MTRRLDQIVIFCLAAALLLFEFLGISSPRYVTVTQIVKTYVPLAARIMLLAWLVWHFCISDIINAIINRTPVR